MSDLEGVLRLQRANLRSALTDEEIQSQGFVTVTHSALVLQNLNAIERHIIAIDHGRVVAYLLAMTKQSRFEVPLLLPMFERFESVQYNGRPVADQEYMVVGQVCVAKEYRGQGILDKCYAAYKKCFESTYDFAITEIAHTNHRSLAAHKRVGFKEIDRYATGDGTQWCMVLWDWK